MSLLTGARGQLVPLNPLSSLFDSLRCGQKIELWTQWAAQMQPPTSSSQLDFLRGIDANRCDRGNASAPAT